MEYEEKVVRAYVIDRFPRASTAEQERLTQDWLTKPMQGEGIADDFEQRARPLKGLTVLDAGSGNGGISIAFAKRAAKTEGVDIEERLISISRDIAAQTGSSAVFTLYEGTTLPFEDNSFDAAVSVSVIEHVDDPINYFSEILRVLKPDGVLYLAFPNKLYPKETHTGLWGLSYLPLSLARLYTKIAKRNPIEENNLHFYTFWDCHRMILSSASGGRKWAIQKEEGTSTHPLKRFVKSVLRTIGIPHQAFLPHVMLILKVSSQNET